ncbi:kazal-type serine protease inhibitor domain-containing protein 1-like [Protopterus annectens]|uniref:kazal-type serine protease inhibitor domain-containing protein 1-like n=1 Tax=Protopterus annectens TaxID=7888 RepID=UPI001CF967A2|nr:kazal-type serine protease inhibitor domain-containing protein 1-like [Protopterus annectens]
MVKLVLLITLVLFAESVVIFPRKTFQHRDWDSPLEEEKECPVCQLELCPSLPTCLAGKVKDRCGCCWECGNTEGKLCDPTPNRSFYGRCGEGLKCMVEVDSDNFGHIPEPQCVCLKKGMICGSDGKTYRNLCKFREAIYSSQTAVHLTIARKGPCKAAPVITKPPRDMVTIEGHDIIFDCAVSSYPMALIEWRKEGSRLLLLGDDSHIAVQTRGGPQQYEITGWLQIKNIQKEDEGIYTCYANNGYGQNSASASLRVVDRESSLVEEVLTDRTDAFDLIDDEDEGLNISGDNEI